MSEIIHHEEIQKILRHGKMLEKQHQEQLIAVDLEIKKIGDFYFQKIREWMSEKFQHPVEKINKMIWSGQIKLIYGSDSLFDFLFEFFEIQEKQKIFYDKDRMLHLIRTNQIEGLNFELFLQFGVNIIFFK